MGGRMGGWMGEGCGRVEIGMVVEVRRDGEQSS